MKLANTVTQAAQKLGVSRSQIYILISSGELQSFKIGRRRLISDRQLHDFVDRKVAANG